MPTPILAIIIDGVGDRPHPDHHGGTPLSVGETPHLDELAFRGVTGLIDPLGPGIVPGSGSGHLSLFDVDPFHGAPSRGALEALGLGVQPGEGVFAARGNFVTLDKDGTIGDRRAGRFNGAEEREQAVELIDAMNAVAPNGVEFLYHPRMGYRFVVKLEGGELGPGVSDTDPKAARAKPKRPRPTDDTDASRLSAELLERGIEAATPILSDHPINQARRQAGLLPASGLVTRGFGPVVAGPSLEQRFGATGRAVAGGNAYRGIAAYLGLDVVECEGATGDTNADFVDKVATAVDALDGADLVYLHLKAPDMLGEDGDFEGKTASLERIDEALRPLVLREDILVGITGDHSTPCVRRAHSGDPVPLLFSGPGVRPDDIETFNEFSVTRGGLGRLQGGAYLRTMMDLTDRTTKTE